MPRARAARTHAQRSEATTASLLDAARERFAASGYRATSLDAICAAAGLTKGALYHHFASKQEVFAGVFEREQERLRAIVDQAMLRPRDPWAAVEAGCSAFLDACQDPGVQRVVLLDAPEALGWEAVRAGEAGALNSLGAGIERAIAAGRIAPRPARPLAHLLFGAVSEGAMAVARAERPAAEYRRVLLELRRVFVALAAS